jgi:hypothetical protein
MTVVLIILKARVEDPFDRLGRLRLPFQPGDHTLDPCHPLGLQVLSPGALGIGIAQVVIVRDVQIPAEIVPTPTTPLGMVRLLSDNGYEFLLLFELKAITGTR